MDRTCTFDQCASCPNVICRCLQVTEEMLLEALAIHQVRTVKEVRSLTGAGDGCSACHKRINAYIERHLQGRIAIPVLS